MLWVLFKETLCKSLANPVLLTLTSHHSTTFPPGVEESGMQPLPYKGSRLPGSREWEWLLQLVLQSQNEHFWSSNSFWLDRTCCPVPPVWPSGGKVTKRVHPCWNTKIRETHLHSLAQHLKAKVNKCQLLSSWFTFEKPLLTRNTRSGLTFFKELDYC